MLRFHYALYCLIFIEIFPKGITGSPLAVCVYVPATFLVFPKKRLTDAIAMLMLRDTEFRAGGKEKFKTRARPQARSGPGRGPRHAWNICQTL